MAAGSEAADLVTVSRKEIGERLRTYHEPRLNLEGDKRNSCLPIDCFFLQLNYSFRKWTDTLEARESVEKVITDITDAFLKSPELKVYGLWFKVDPEYNWPLTYFLDAEEDKKRENCPDFRVQYHKAWFDFEEHLNTNVRQKLREQLKEKDPSFHKVSVVLMRACVYVRDDIDDSIL